MSALFLPLRQKKQSVFRAATSRSQRPKSHYTKNRPGKRRGGRRAALVIASSDNRCIPIPITSSHTIIDEAADFIFLLHFQPTAVEREREGGGGTERAMKEEITKIIKSREEVSGGVG